MARIVLIVGSTHGTTLTLARQCADHLARFGHSVVVLDKPVLDRVAESSQEVLLVFCATIGRGEIPLGLRPLMAQIRENGRALVDKRYAVVAFGDSDFKDFAQAGKALDKCFEALNMQRVGELLTVDAAQSLQPRERVFEWIERWQALI